VSGLRSVHILRASHTDARPRHSQPASSLIGGRGRSLGSPPTPGRGGRGATASGHRRRRPGSSHRARLAHPARSGPRRGGGEERPARSLLLPPSFPPAERRRHRRRFPPGARSSKGGHVLSGRAPSVQSAGWQEGGTKGARVHPARGPAARVRRPCTKWRKRSEGASTCKITCKGIY
jgi:hypothetical protein